MTVTVSMEAAPAFNGGRMTGELSLDARDGLASFSNVSFDEAATMKRLTAPSENRWGAPLVTATPATIRVLPGQRRRTRRQRKPR